MYGKIGEALAASAGGGLSGIIPSAALGLAAIGASKLGSYWKSGGKQHPYKKYKYSKWRKRRYYRRKRPGALIYKVRKRRKYFRRRKPSRIWRAFKNLKREVENDTGTFLYKYRATGNLGTNAKAINHLGIVGNTITTIEASIDNLPVFNPALPDTYTFVDFTSGTQQKEVRLRTFTKLLIKNNYNAPVKVTIYLCYPKADTSISTTGAMTNGLTDVGSGLGITTSMIFPKHSPQFNDLWRIKKTESKVLEGGSVMTMNNMRSY